MTQAPNDFNSESSDLLTSAANQSPALDMGGTPIEIGTVVPLEIGVPVYGFVVPVVVLTTLVTNSFVVFVLSRPQLINSPSNRILLAISLAETLTGMSSLPWLLYYFTLGGYHDEKEYGLPSFWCHTYTYFSELVPTIFHAIALWLTVYLAIHRFFYINQVTTCLWGCFDLSRTTLAIVLICVFSILLELPLIAGRWTGSVEVEFGAGDQKYKKRLCMHYSADWVWKLNRNYVYAVHYWLLVVLVYVGPCLLLSIFTALLIVTIRKVNRRRKRLFANKISGSQSASSRTNRRALSNTTRMLVAVIGFVLLTETPAAVVFMLHVLHMTFNILPPDSYHAMNIALIVRNVFVLVTYPFKIAVYLSTSNEFRNTVKQLFLRRPSTTTNCHVTENRVPKDSSKNKTTRKAEFSAALLINDSSAKSSGVSNQIATTSSKRFKFFKKSNINKKNKPPMTNNCVVFTNSDKQNGKYCNYKIDKSSHSSELQSTSNADQTTIADETVLFCEMTDEQI